MNASKSLEIILNGVNNELSICPWQEIRVMPYLHWQIDIILTPEQHYTFNKYDIESSLYSMYLGDYTDLPVDKYIKKLHMAANPQPLFKYWNMAKALESIDKNKLLSRGWVYGQHSTYTLFASRKRDDGRFEISGVKFCRKR